MPYTARPTLFQTLLGRPSQTYSFPTQKQYHLEKQHLSVVAVELSLPNITVDEPVRALFDCLRLAYVHFSMNILKSQMRHTKRSRQLT